MSDLPWLLVYGRFVWPAGLILAAALACLLAWIEARRRGRESVSWGRRELVRPATVQDLADGARAVISGVIVAEGEAPPAFDTMTSAAATTARAERRPDSLKDALDRSASLRAPALSLRCDDGAIVHLEGPVAVLAGSREVWTGCTLPMLPRAVRRRVEGADEAGAAMLSNQHVVLASVAPGDRVQAFGRLVSRQDIRSVAVRWSLVPAPEPVAEAGDAPLAAVPVVFEGVGRVSGPLRRAVARAGILGAAGAFAGAVLVGELAHFAVGGGVAGSATVTSRDDQPLEFRSVSADLIAAATPFRRDLAVRRIARQVRRDARNAGEVRAVSALWSLGSECRVGVEILARHGRFREAVSLGERCGDPASRWTAAQVAMLSGEPARASRLIDGFAAPPEGFRGQEVFAALVHLYAGRPGPAAVFLERAIVAAEARVERNLQLEQALRCGAAALQVRAGRSDAARELRTRLVGPQGWRCALYLADLERGPARLTVLREARERLGAPWGEWAQLDAMLRLEAGGRDVDPMALPEARPWILLHDRTGEVFHAPGLARAAHEALAGVPDAALAPGMRAARTRLATSMAVFESVFGRHDEARRLAASVATDLDAAPEVRVRGGLVAALQAGIELRAGDPARARGLLASAGYEGDQSMSLANFLTGNVFNAAQWTARYGLAAPLDDWSGLGAGDGEALVATLTNAPSHDPFLEPSLAFGVRRLASGVEPVRAWLAWGARPPCWRCQMRYTGAELSHMAMAARALGMRDEAAAAERGLAGTREALLRRDAAVTAMLIETM